jgi:hypothetical protein
MMPSPQVRGSRVGPDSPLRSFSARKFARPIRMNHSKSSSYTFKYTFTITISSYFPVERPLSIPLVSLLGLPSTGIYPIPSLWDPTTEPGGFQANRAASLRRGTTTPLPDGLGEGGMRSWLLEALGRWWTW